MLFRKHIFSYSPESKKCGFEGYFIQTKHKQFPAKFSTEPSARGRRGGALLRAAPSCSRQQGFIARGQAGNWSVLARATPAGRLWLGHAWR